MASLSLNYRSLCSLFIVAAIEHAGLFLNQFLLLKVLQMPSFSPFNPLQAASVPSVKTLKIV